MYSLEAYVCSQDDSSDEGSGGGSGTGGSSSSMAPKSRLAKLGVKLETNDVQTCIQNGAFDAYLGKVALVLTDPPYGMS